MEELIDKLKVELIEALNLEEITPEDIDILERNYGIKIENPAKGKEIFYSVRTLADYITAHQK